MIYKEFINAIMLGDLSIQDIIAYFKGSTKEEIKDTLMMMYARSMNVHPEEESRILEAIDKVEKHYKVALFDYDVLLGKEVKAMPKELQNEYFTSVLECLTNKGYFEHIGNMYKWNKTTALYAYFIEKVTEKMKLQDSLKRVPWKLFEWVTNHNAVSCASARNAVERVGKEPKGSQEINFVLESYCHSIKPAK